MEMKKGSLSINSENLFPIIKKWMYSDKDIFVREMISNGTDAITKRKKLALIGETTLRDDYKPKITVRVNDKEKTLKFIDNGVGMTAEEVEKDITEIAFSGATEFVEKYKDKSDEDQIIGHFGLGFYSAFMVADLVEIDTLSCTEGAEPVHWECDGSTDYEMATGTRKVVGTEITLHINEDSLEFANEYKVRETLEKYCSFMPYEIYLENETKGPGTQIIDEKDLKDTDIVIEHIHEDAKKEEYTDDKGEKHSYDVPEKNQVKIQERPVSISDTHPLWQKNPSECTDEEYRDFYRKVFQDYREPLFWIHLNMDYPYNLRGILYFPRINTEYDRIEGTIKLYSNQVFIADNIKEVIPEYLMLLKGVIDCPDLPLNVSRSALQNDGFVQKISDYISKKVADKLTGMCKTDRENYEKYWDDISPFIKYGTLKDEKFSDRMMDYVLYKDLDDKYYTMKEYLEHISPEDEKKSEGQTEAAGGEETAEKTADRQEEKDSESQKKTKDGSEKDDREEEKPKTVIYYVTDPAQQSQYINMFRAQQMDAVVLRYTIDSAFIQHVEQKNEELKFQRIDADLSDEMKEDSGDLGEETRNMQELFRKVLGNDKINVRVENLKDDGISSILTMTEESRRMSDMMKMYGMADQMDMSMFTSETTLVLNAKNKLVQYIEDHRDSEEDVRPFCEQLYDLALISNRPLTPDEMTRFVSRSNELLTKLAEES